MGIAVILHVLSVVVWVGGMFFAHQCLRPVAASQLQPPVRLSLWVGVFGRFFPWVLLTIAGVLGSGLWMLFGQFGGFKGLPLYVHAMFGLGILMMLIFFYVFFVPYARLKSAVSAADWPDGASALAQIRLLVGINLSIGLLTLAIGSGGRWFVI